MLGFHEVMIPSHDITRLGFCRFYSCLMRRILVLLQYIIPGALDPRYDCTFLENDMHD
jgi:hypothetical protein